MLEFLLGKNISYKEKEIPCEKEKCASEVELLSSTIEELISFLRKSKDSITKRK
jgi:hypothetical protein